ncbi:hypothetical protein [Nocardiopsis sp. NPDC006938]|uniref:hypothetical protein n=1 Tax=Nocardiopsis sp. NPDC006938 TaxID=3364337 RepID=UPI0036956FB1
MSTTSTPKPSAETGAGSTPARRADRVWEVVGWVGFGLVVGSFLAAFLVLRRVEGDDFGWALLLPEEGRGVWQFPLFLAAVVAYALVRRNLREPDPDGLVTPGFFALLFSVLALLQFTLWTNLPQSSFVFTAELFDKRYGVRPGDVALWGIALPLLFGLILLLASHRWPRTGASTRRWWLAPFVIGVALSLLADPAARALSEYVPTRHTSLGQVPDAAPYPDSVTRLGWEWRPPEGVSVRHVERGPLGPVVAISDGVVGLDGGTGEELWSYRRPGGDVQVTLHPGSDRAQVVLRSNETAVGWNEGGDHLRGGVVVLLDTSTGRIEEEFDADSLGSSDDTERLLPGFVLAAGERFGDMELGVSATGDSDRLWSFPVPGGRDEVEDGMVCGTVELRLDSGTGGSNLLVRGDQVLVSYRCADMGDFESEWEARDLVNSSDERFVTHLVALDLRTGEERWHRTWDASDGAYGQRVYLSDGGPVLNPGAAPVVVVGNMLDEGSVILDARDGSDVLTNEDNARFTGVVQADTEGAVTAELDQSPDREEDSDLVVERRDSSGEVVGTVRLPASIRPTKNSGATEGSTVGLTGGVAQAALDAREAQKRGALVLTAADFRVTDPGFGEPTAGTGVLTGQVERWESSLRLSDGPRPRALAVPGAVVSYLSREGGHVYGWQS